MPKVNAPTLVPASVGLVASPAGGLVAPGPTTDAGSGLVSSLAAPNPNAVLPNSDFIVIDKPKRKAVCLVFADGGCGKTTFGLKYTPQPAFLIGFDGRSEYVEEEQKLLGYPIGAVQIPPPSVLQKTDNVRKAAGEALAKFFRNYDAAIEASKSDKARTIVIDTGSELGEIITLAVRGTLESAKGDFGRSKDQINQIWWKIFQTARYTGKAHVIILARASSIWENNEPTGDFKARVSDTVRDAVDFSLHIRLGMGAQSLLGLAGGLAGVGSPGGLVSGTGLMPIIPGSGFAGPQKEFEIVVKKSGNKNPLQELGVVYRQSDWGEDGPFVYACTQLMPGSRPEDWK